jgi:hypothetical protein
MKRTQISTAVSKETRRQVDELVANYGYSLRDVITVAIENFYNKVLEENKMSDTQVITGSGLKIEDGRLFAHGEGEKWHNCASADEKCRLWDGSEGDHTVQEAYDKGILEVHVGFAFAGIVEAS